MHTPVWWNWQTPGTQNPVSVSDVRVRPPSPAPCRSKLYIACSDFFIKVRARSCRCSSFPNRSRFAGLRFGFGRRPGNNGIYTVAMLYVVADGIPFTTTFSFSEQTSSLTHSAAFPFQPRSALLDSRLVLGEDMEATASIVLQCYKHPECASVRDA